MRVDRLQEKIRKLKNPFLLELAPVSGWVPGTYEAQGTEAERCGCYCRDLLGALKGKLPGVRFSFSAFALLGPEGLAQLQLCLKTAGELGYYVLLDAPELWSVELAQRAANLLLGKGSAFPCHGVLISAYQGSDFWKPFLPLCGDGKKDLFVAARTGNKSAPELQDLLTGSRQVYLAAVDHVNRSAGDLVDKSGYSRVGVAMGASSQEALRTVRSKYTKIFILADGLDYPGGTVKNTAAAFDKLGHGAAVSSGSAIACAWQQAENCSDPIQAAEEALERLRRNISRYVTIL